MNNIYKLFNAVFTYGSFEKPFVIKILNSKSSSTLKKAAYSLLYSWNSDFEKAIYHIDRSIKSCSSTNIKYFLLSIPYILTNSEKLGFKFITLNICKCCLIFSTFGIPPSKERIPLMYNFVHFYFPLFVHSYFTIYIYAIDVQ